MKNKYFIVALMLVAVLPFRAFSEDEAVPTSCSCAADGDGNTCRWEYDDATKTLTISGNGTMKNYTDPWIYRENRTPWASYASDIKNIVVGEGITKISSSAFAYTAVENVSLPESLTTIGVQAFAACRQLHDIKFPSGLQEIEGGAFQYAPLKDLDIPENVRAIGGVAFTSDTIESITLSSSTALGAQIFWDRGGVYPKQTLKVYCKGDVAACEANIKSTFYNSSPGSTAVHPDLSTTFQVYRKNRRIYTIDEANQDAGKKNKVMIRYK